MSLNKTINRESLHKAVARCVVTNDIYDEVAANNREAMNRISSRHIDARDFGDLATFLRYKPIFDDPVNGKELSEEEFRAECQNIIDAFANDDREKIFGYLDQWYKFVSEYNAPENIQTETEALKHFVYLRSQQGLTVTKMAEYPEYVRSRFPDMDSMMRLQYVQQEIFLQASIGTYVFMDNDLEISVASKRKYDKDPKQYLAGFTKAREERSASGREKSNKRSAFTEAFIKATEPYNPAPKDSAAIRKFEVSDWVKAYSGKDVRTEVSKEDLESLNNAMIMCLGSNETGYGVVHNYMHDRIIDMDGYRTIFIDGVSVYDLIPEPKTINDAQMKLFDALCNKTGVVSIAHVAEIDGEFKYRVDVLDIRDGNDPQEYVDKIHALEESEEERKALFSKEAKDLTDTLTAGKEKTLNDKTESVKESYRNSLNRKETLLKAEVGLIDPSTVKKTYKETREEIEINKQNVGPAFFVLDEVRTHYRRYHRESMKNKAYLKSLFPTVIDDRDFPDIMTFTRLAKTLGVGDKDLTEAEFAEETEKALTAWSKQDHAAMKPYLDKMYDFVMNYTMPVKIESVEDIMKSMMYLRVQQTVTVKLVENPWYVDMRFPTAIEKARFDAFKAQYYALYNDIYNGTIKALGAEIGGREYTQILKQMRNPKTDLSEDDLLDNVNMGLQSYKDSKYTHEVKSYLKEKKARLDADTECPERSVYKISLPESAMSLKGMSVDAPEYSEEITSFEIGFVGVIYNHDLNDSKTLREYGYPCASFEDIARLIFIDGEALYDSVIQEKGNFSSNFAEKKLLHALINQTGIVQFAHVYNDGNDLKVSLETMDVSQKGIDSYNNPQYVKKLYDYEVNNAHYDAVKNKIRSELLENKRILDEEKAKLLKEQRAAENAKYLEEAKQDEIDLLGIQDVFDSVEYDENGNIKEKVKKDDSLNILFKSERGRALRVRIGELANFSHGDINVNQVIVKINEILSKEGKVSEADYNKLWKDVWVQAIGGLKEVADSERYTKPVAFAEATDMVEKLMQGALKLYGHNIDEVKPFGGMTTEEMTKYLKAGIPTWEVTHYSDSLNKMNEVQIGNLANIEFTLKQWKKTSMEDYKNMTDVKGLDAYRNLDDTLNAQGKRYVTASLIEFYDMVNVLARNLVENDLYDIDVDAVRADMYKFSANLKKAILEIGVVDEKGFEKVSGNTLPLEAQIEKFGADLQKLTENNGLEDEKENNIDNDIKNENSVLSEDEVLNEDDLSVDNIVNENNMSVDDIDTSSNKKEGVIDTSSNKKEEVIDTSSNKKEKVVEYRGMRENELEEDVSEYSENQANYRFDKDTTYDNIIRNDDIESKISEESSVKDDVIIGDRSTNIAKAMRINFPTFMAGRYSVPKENPNSAYSVVTNGELRNLATLFGGINPQADEAPNYIPVNQQVYEEISPDDVKVSDDFAAKYGIKFDLTDIESVIKGFITENSDDGMEAVDKTTFEKEYKLLFGDLYMQTLHATNKLCSREGKIITSEQMDGAMRGLDKIMREAASKVGYPEKIINGGIKPENFKKMQNSFADTFVPKDSSELALRTMQANSGNFNFLSANWKEGLGFTAFTDMVSNEKENLLGIEKTDQAKLKAAQMYRAMTKYNGNRSWISKFFSWRKNGREKREIEQFKELAKNLLEIGDREFEELSVTKPSASFNDLKDGIEKNFQKADENKNLKGSMISQSSDELSSSMREDESEKSSVVESKSNNLSMREQITVPEADHKLSRDKEKRTEDIKKEAEKVKENDLKNRAPRA